MDIETPAPAAETATADLSEILTEQSSPAVQPQPEAKAEPQADPEAKPEISEDDPKHPFWYRNELKQRKAREKALERELEQLRQKADAPQPQTFEHPQQYFEHMRIVDRLERSEDRFIDKHGEQEFESVKEWLATRPDIEAWAQQQRHPWGAAHQQYQRERLSAEIGDDPNAWREKERERLRAEIMAEVGQVPMSQRPHIPTPASAQRSAAPRGGVNAGPTPLGDILKR